MIQKQSSRAVKDVKLEKVPQQRFAELSISRKKCMQTVISLEPGKTINSTWYTESCLPLVIKAINLQRPGTGLRGTFLLHDNANSHSSKMTRQFTEESGLHILLPPLFSRSSTLRLLALS
ncbi:Mariner transposase [Oopsacas minuta]|uniref:Mariner transposase n=1 Tax=Oopsacas minuta TaxID=111878 RepID=A0AAV7JMA0_9METZ|nr:Mariner transposase [Oopsacas minuta]